MFYYEKMLCVIGFVENVNSLEAYSFLFIATHTTENLLRFFFFFGN